VRHDTSAATLAAPDPALDIHPVRPDEAGFVVECLVTALGRGLAQDEPAVDLAAWARTRYQLHDKATVCLVGSLDGRAVCHGLGYRRADRHGRARVLYLVDVFVVAEYQGRRLSQAMSAAMMGQAREAGYEVIESDVVLAPGSERLRDGLRRAGWTEDRVRWSRG
jgi:GNAT superfamily N-acetyltransferase